jgi:hypothetical protein
MWRGDPVGKAAAPRRRGRVRAAGETGGDDWFFFLIWIIYTIIRHGFT